MIRRPPRSPLFPATAPSRSHDDRQRTAPLGQPAARLPCRQQQREARFADVAHPAGERARALPFAEERDADDERLRVGDRKSTRLNSSHANISYAVFCLKKKK